ncbi:MAG: DUF3592 domain-containing protein [Deltaproteobacteria bacterium]|nr:DUF3592 domain-containing protein [Deltaproteobacteria bacterium]
MRCSATKVRERDSVTYEIVLRNKGRQPSETVELWFDVRSTSAMLAFASQELSYSLEDRMLQWRGRIGPIEERSFVIKLITLPSSSGTIISNPVWAVWGETKKYFDSKTEVLPRETTGKILFMLGGVEIGWLEITILGYFLLVPLFLIVVPRLIRWRERRRFEKYPDVSWRDSDSSNIMVYAMCIAFLISLAAMFFFASLILGDIRKFSSYEKTTCTILDKKLISSTGSTGKTKSRIYSALVSVRYDAKGKEIISADSITKRAFMSSSERSAGKTLGQYELGKSYPCWFNPEDPPNFLLERSLSWGWYLLCFGPLIIFLIASQYLFRKVRGPDAPGEMYNTPIQSG